MRHDEMLEVEIMRTPDRGRYGGPTIKLVIQLRSGAEVLLFEAPAKTDPPEEVFMALSRTITDRCGLRRRPNRLSAG